MDLEEALGEAVSSRKKCHACRFTHRFWRIRTEQAVRWERKRSSPSHHHLLRQAVHRPSSLRSNMISSSEGSACSRKENPPYCAPDIFPTSTNI
nr:hypothetical protein Itr_chr12CG14620 [Ipomoea trifida]